MGFINSDYFTQENKRADQNYNLFLRNIYPFGYRQGYEALFILGQIYHDSKTANILADLLHDSLQNEIFKDFMLENDFTHKQYSCYASKEIMDDFSIELLTKRLSRKFTWLSTCVQNFCNGSRITRSKNYIL